MTGSDSGPTLLSRGDNRDRERLEDGRYRLAFQTGELADRLRTPIIIDDDLPYTRFNPAIR